MNKVKKIDKVFFKDFSEIREIAELQKSIILLVKLANELADKVNLLIDNRK